MRPIALSLLFTAAPALAQITVPVPCAADNTLYEDALGNTSNGSGSSIFCGLTATGAIRRALLRFDVDTVVPAGAHIVSAQLTLNVAQTTVFPPMTAYVHTVLQAWGEGASVALGGGGGGALAQAGDATWLHNFYNTSFWSTPGGRFAAAPSFTITLPNFGLATTNGDAGLIADVQSFLDNPAQNFGWLIKLDETLPSTAHRMDSREGVTKPQLLVTYMTAGTNGTWGTGCLVGAGNFGAAFVGAPIGGTTIQLTQNNAPPIAIGTTFFTLDLDPVGVTLLPTCTVYLPLAGLIPGGVFVTNGAGAASEPFPVPAGFPGYLVVGQSIVLTNNLLGFVVSNAALTCLQ